MELTNELKERFKALYWGQDVFRGCYGTRNTVNEHNITGNFECEYLELRPLSSITEEEKIELCDFCFPDETSDEVCHKLYFAYSLLQTLTIDAVDWLRSKGFLLPFMGTPVDQWVEWGVVKLKTE